MDGDIDRCPQILEALEKASIHSPDKPYEIKDLMITTVSYNPKAKNKEIPSWPWRQDAVKQAQADWYNPVIKVSPGANVNALFAPWWFAAHLKDSGAIRFDAKITTTESNPLWKWKSVDFEAFFNKWWQWLTQTGFLIKDKDLQTIKLPSGTEVKYMPADKVALWYAVNLISELNINSVDSFKIVDGKIVWVKTKDATRVDYMINHLTDAWYNTPEKMIQLLHDSKTYYNNARLEAQKQWAWTGDRDPYLKKVFEWWWFEKAVATMESHVKKFREFQSDIKAQSALTGIEKLATPELRCSDFTDYVKKTDELMAHAGDEYLKFIKEYGEASSDEAKVQVKAQCEESVQNILDYNKVYLATMTKHYTWDQLFPCYVRYQTIINSYATIMNTRLWESDTKK